MSAADAPRLSVVVGLISGRKDRLQACLEALHQQSMKLPMEIIVPYDPPCRDVAALAEAYPAVTFLEAADLDTAEARRGGSREHHDTLRTRGLRAARGEVIALTEDHAKTAPSWCEEMVAALERLPRAAAVGGAVECESARALNHAVWYCDFGRYQNPLPEGPAAYVSDSNVAYRRKALEAVPSVWEDDYHETEVHWALTKAGNEICLTPRVLVWQAREDLRFGAALRERYVWGRSFAGTRMKGAPLPKRLFLAAASAILPFLLTARVFGNARRRGHTLHVLRLLPLIFLLHTVWALGEAVGYLRGRP